jgi:tetratricopeptide (TPR) repeat protein
MDCRKTLGLGLCLLLGAAGCSHNVAVAPSMPPAQANNSPAPATVEMLPPGAVVRKAADQPQRTPKASTCVAYGDWASSEANAADVSDTLRQEKREKARKAYQQALAIDPQYLPAYESLASLYGNLKDHTHAVATYRKAAEMFPKEPRVYYELAKCYGANKEWEPAIEALARAVQLDPENRQYVDTLGWMQARVGRYDESLATFRKVHDEAEAHYRLALMLEHLKQPELCRQQLQAALIKDPHQERARALLAKLDETPAGPVQRTSYPETTKAEADVGSLPAVAPIQRAAYSESAKAELTDATPTPEPQPKAPPLARRGRVVILPPPPQMSIQYEDAVAPSLPPPSPKEPD